jgi:hypothetical protein
MTAQGRATQWMQVVSALQELGGIATLSQLNRCLLDPGGDAIKWSTKTPEATIRRIVRNTPDHIHVLKPGLYCLQELAERYAKDYDLSPEGDVPPDVADRNHWYYQGLLIEIGNDRGYKTYVPAQDRNRTFVNQNLGDICHTTTLPDFGYQSFVRKARTVDVIWFNRREMPSKLFEVEFSTDMLNSLTKFNELRDFYAHFTIVAPPHRSSHFADRIELDTFREIRSRVTFTGTDKIDERYDRIRWPITA